VGLKIADFLLPIEDCPISFIGFVPQVETTMGRKLLMQVCRTTSHFCGLVFLLGLHSIVVSQPHYGVHYAVDIEGRRLVAAVPFPEKIY